MAKILDYYAKTSLEIEKTNLKKLINQKEHLLHVLSMIDEDIEWFSNEIRKLENYINEINEEDS